MDISKWIIPDDLDAMPKLAYQWNADDYYLVQRHILDYPPVRGERLIQFTHAVTLGYTPTGGPMVVVTPIRLYGYDYMLGHYQ